MKKIALTIASITLMFFSLAFAETYTIKEDSLFGCKSRTHFEKLIQYITDDDKQAFVTALDMALKAKKCIMFKKNQIVYVVKIDIIGGMVLLRPKGGLAEYWAKTRTIYGGS
jgi:hypothetical protein